MTVVGLGPAGREWLTPEAQAALAEADDLVGYGPYVDRVPANPRQQRHSSDNRVVTSNPPNPAPSTTTRIGGA